MRKLLFLSVLSVLAAWQSTLAGAEDPWQKVRELKSGTELRIIKKGARQPILATFDEVTDDSVLIATKKEQLAIPKEEVERIDFRPRSESRVTKENRTTTTDPDPSAPTGLGRTNNTPGTSSSTNYSFGSKPDFQTVYRATSSAPAK